MLYKEFNGEKLSALGLGCMRLPVIDGDAGKIDEEKFAEMVEYAMKNGINYYDTAWPYHNKMSEKAVGKVLKKYPRDSFYLATKFPGFSPETFENPKEIFETQLANCQVEYFDFYLCHNVNEGNVENFMNKGVVEYLVEEKAAGRIKHLGFSCHGQYEVLKMFLDKFPGVFEFCQLQINWLDWKLQRADQKVALLEERGLGVWVMEPVRGGKLAVLDDELMSKLTALRPDEKAPAWALRYVNQIPAVKMVLSGMSNMDQLMENIKTMSEDKPLNEAELAALAGITEDMLKRNTLPCTGCSYCTEGCPMQLNIPRLMAVYNEMLFNQGGTTAPRVMGALEDDKKPSACLECGACAAVCPQHIDIPGMMKDFMVKYDGFYNNK